jgi:hypothetical protein
MICRMGAVCQLNCNVSAQLDYVNSAAICQLSSIAMCQLNLMLSAQVPLVNSAVSSAITCQLSCWQHPLSSDVLCHLSCKLLAEP